MHIIHGPANVREGAAHNDVENTTLTVTLLIGAGLLLSVFLALATGGWLGSAEHLGWI